MRTQSEIVREVNRCLNLTRLNLAITPEEWDQFADLVSEGKLVFSGDPTGFHIKWNEDGTIVEDCGVTQI